MSDSEVERLLRAAAARDAEAAPTEPPFGFETRVVAAWRAARGDGNGEAWALARLLRRVALGAMIVAVCASAGAAWQLQQDDDLTEAGGAYAIADTLIEASTSE